MVLLTAIASITLSGVKSAFCLLCLQSARTQLATAAADERSCKEELSSVRQRTNSLAEKCSLLRQQLEQCEADRTSLQCQAQETSQKYQNHISELESKVHTLRMTSTSNLELTKSSLDKAQTQVQHLTEENLSLRRQVTKTNGELEVSCIASGRSASAFVFSLGGGL
eukprot:scpid19303/ scgid1495/ 